VLILIVTIELVFQKGPDKLFTGKTIWKKNKEWHKNRNERENMYTNKPKWSHKEM